MNSLNLNNTQALKRVCNQHPLANYNWHPKNSLYSYICLQLAPTALLQA